MDSHPTLPERRTPVYQSGRLFRPLPSSSRPEWRDRLFSRNTAQSRNERYLGSLWGAPNRRTFTALETTTGGNRSVPARNALRFDRLLLCRLLTERPVDRRTSIGRIVIEHAQIRQLLGRNRPAEI